jgi:hypothetical protein
MLAARAWMHRHRLRTESSHPAERLNQAADRDMGEDVHLTAGPPVSLKGFNSVAA